MLSRIVITAALGLLLAAPASAQTQTLMPGVTYEKAVQFTPHGPVALHVVTGPRPEGLYALRPVLSNETIVGRETVTLMQKRLSSTATAVGVNADFFAPSTGRPSGVLMRDGVVASPPYGDRSSVGIAVDGSLDIRRVEFFGTWRGLGQRRPLTDMNQFPVANGISLFTPAYGPATPAASGTTEVVIHPLPPATPNTDLTGPVVHVAGAGGTAIPPDGAVLVARGTAAARLAEEASIGSTVTLRIIFRPEWTGILEAVGGGPVIVRNRGPVFRSNEAFTSSQLGPRHPRAPAVGQLADGRIRLVVVDGRRPGYSVGMTNFELAQTMVRLGAVTAAAFDGGGSSTLAFNGTLLNRPSDSGGERPVPNALQLMYYGVYAPTPEAVVSPNGDGYRRAAARALLQGRRPFDRDRHPLRAGERAGVHRDAHPGAGHLPRRLPAHARRPVRGAGAARRGSLAAPRHRNRRPAAHLDDDAAVHGQQHARLREALAPLARRPRAWQADDPGRASRSPGRRG